MHELVAGYLGVGTKKAKAKAKTGSGSLREFASELASGFNGIKKTRAR